MLNQRGFSRTGVADNADKFALFDFQIDIVHRYFPKRRIRTVYMGQMLNFNDGQLLILAFLLTLVSLSQETFQRLNALIFRDDIGGNRHAGLL